MNENTEKSFIYCTPFLDEVDRIRRSCGNYSRFVEPRPYAGSKLDNFNELLADGRDIAVTHTTFLNATEETLDLIRTGKYTLVIDEALDVVKEFNKVQTVECASRQSVTEGDISFLLARGVIQIAEDNHVVWRGGEYGEDFKFREVQRLANLKRLYCIDGKLLLAIFPPEMFTCFDAVYIMTYLFDGSVLKLYLDMFGLSYERKSVKREGDVYSLSAYDASIDAEFRRKCMDLIHVYDDPKLKERTWNAFSKTWYSNGRSDDRLRNLKARLVSFFRYHARGAKARNGDIMWTCFNDFRDEVTGSGYTMSRQMTEDEKLLPEEDCKELKRKLSCFVECNAKATNEYGSRWALAYCVNMFPPTMIRRFFTDGNSDRESRGLPAINPNDELYAVSCMIQWIFRSRIRKGEEIVIFIPSKRMRTLLDDWMNCRI